MQLKEAKLFFMLHSIHNSSMNEAALASMQKDQDDIQA